MKPHQQMMNESRKIQHKEWVKSAKKAKIPKEIVDKVKDRAENRE